jgi:hypothetical protein
MEGKLDGFIAAEIIKEHLPVHIVLDDKDADLILVGQSLKEDDPLVQRRLGREG